jgi:hypothetical protein
MSIVYIQIMKSDLDGKKYKAVFYNKDRSKVKTTHFGAKGMSDYNIHKDDERKERYLARHKVRENWNDYTSAGSLARWILWNKTSLSASFNDYLKRFKLKKY